jgi:NAD(P)-dependent dehydrogenase (short-subunit alcohol dehydrogenase family)
MSEGLAPLPSLRSGPADLAGRVAVVTGAARGIGAEIARTLHAAGASVAVLDIRDADEGARRIDPDPGRARGIEVDLTDPAAVDAAFARVVTELGRLDILVNNAGLGDRVQLDGLSVDHLDHILATNLRSTVLCCQAAAARMREAGGGKIVNVSSVSAKVGGVTSRDPRTGEGRSGPSYAAAKGGIISLTRWLAKDGGRYGVLVNAVCPGPIGTDAIAGAEYDLSQTPIDRIGTTADVSLAVLFLVSQMSNYITGQTLNVDGGLRFD